MVPKPESPEWASAVSHWRSLSSDAGAEYDRTVIIDGSSIAPTVTWGTSPEDTAPITASVPSLANVEDPTKRVQMERALKYMGLTESQGQPLTSIPVDKVFIGSCTNGRIEDIRSVAAVAKGRTVAPGVVAMVVPGSGVVREQAIEEGLDKILEDAGFDFRQPG